MDFYKRISGLVEHQKTKNNKWKTEINPQLMKCLDLIIENNLGKYIVIFTNKNDYYFKIHFFKPIDINYINSLFVSDNKQVSISTTVLVIFYKGVHFSLTPNDEKMNIRETFFYNPENDGLFISLANDIQKHVN